METNNRKFLPFMIIWGHSFMAVVMCDYKSCIDVYLFISFLYHKKILSNRYCPITYFHSSLQGSLMCDIRHKQCSISRSDEMYKKLFYDIKLSLSHGTCLEIRSV